MKLALCIIVQTIIVVNLMVDTVCCIYRSFIIYIIFHLNIFVFRWFKKNKMKKNCKKNTNFFFFFMYILFIMIYLHVQIDPELLVYWFAELFKQVTVKSNKSSVEISFAMFYIKGLVWFSIWQPFNFWKSINEMLVSLHTVVWSD